MRVTIGVAEINGTSPKGRTSFHVDPHAHRRTRAKAFLDASGADLFSMAHVHKWLWKPAGIGVDAPLPNWWDLPPTQLALFGEGKSLYVGCRDLGDLKRLPLFAHDDLRMVTKMSQLTLSNTGAPFQMVALDASSSHASSFTDVAKTLALSHGTVLAMEAFPRTFSDGYYCPYVPVVARFVHPVIQAVLHNQPRPSLKGRELVICFDGKISQDGTEGPLSYRDVTALLKQLELDGASLVQLLMVSPEHASAVYTAYSLWTSGATP